MDNSKLIPTRLPNYRTILLYLIIILSLIGCSGENRIVFMGPTKSAAELLSLSLTGPSSLRAGDCSSPFTVRLQNPSSVSIELKVALSGPSSGTFFRDATCTTPLSESFLAIPIGKGAQEFYYTNRKAGAIKLEVSESRFSSGLADLTVKPGAISARTSTISTSISSVLANGLDVTTLNIDLKDAYGNPISGVIPTVSVSGSGNVIIQPSHPTTDEGRTRGSLASNVAETKTLALLSPVGLSSVTQRINFVAGPVSLQNSGLGAAPDSLVADGIESSMVNITLKDANGNLVSGKTVSLSSNRGSSDLIMPTSVMTNDGIASFTVKSILAGPASLTAVDVTDSNLLIGNVGINFYPAGVSASQSSIIATPKILVADGIENSTVTITLKDANGNLVSGKAVSLTSNRGSSDLIFPTSALTINGVASFSVKSSLAGPASLTVVDVTDSNLLIGSVGINFVSGRAAKLSFVTQPSSAIAGQILPSQPSIEILDANNNRVTSGIDSMLNISLSIYSGTGTLSGILFKNAVAGEADFSGNDLSIELAGSKILRASIVGTPTITQNSLSFIIFHGEYHTSTSSISASPLSLLADGLVTTQVTLTLKDIFGNPVSGVITSFSVSGSNNIIVQPSTPTNASGQAIGTLASTVAELKTIAISGPMGLEDVTTQATFIPGTVEASQSSISGNPMTVIANGSDSSIVIVTLLDVNGNPVSGKTVTLSSNRGIADSITPLSAITNNGTALFTVKSTLSGQPTLTATDVSDSNLQIGALEISFMPGPVSLTQSSVFAIPSSINADGVDTSTVSVYLKDTNENFIPGKIVSLSSNRGIDDTIAAITNVDGIATFSVKSSKPGKPILSAFDVTDSNLEVGSVTLTVSNPSATQLVFTTQPSNTAVGQAFNPAPIVELRNTDGTLVTTGTDATSPITLSLISGSGSLNGLVTVNAIGGRATFSGVSVGTGGSNKRLRATKESGPLYVESNIFNMSEGPPTLTLVADRLLPDCALNIGTLLTIDFNNTNHAPPDDGGMTYSCLFDQYPDGEVNTNSNAVSVVCSLLPGGNSFSTTTGIFNWTPGKSAYGAYEIKITGTNSFGTTHRIFVVDVKHPMPEYENLRAHYDTLFANGTSAYLQGSANTTWRDLSGNNFHGTNSNAAFAIWMGTGSISSDPFRLNYTFSGTTDFGSSVMSGLTTVLFQAWINPSNPTSLGNFILGNGGDSENGFQVRQSTTKPGTLEFIIGKQPPSSSGYSALIQADAPVGYWRLGESSGTTAYDFVGNTGNGTYEYTGSGSLPILGSAGSLQGDPNTSVSFLNTRRNFARLPSNAINGPSRSVEVWFKTETNGPIWAMQDSGTIGVRSPTSSATNAPLLWVGIDGYLRATFINTTHFITSSVHVMDGNWHHAVLTGTSPTETLYVDGQKVGTYTVNLPYPNLSFSQLGAGFGDNTSYTASGWKFFTGTIDEAAYYNRELTAFEVASHYSAGMGYCSSPILSKASAWQQIAGVYDGVFSTFYINGRPTCRLPVSEGLTSPVGNLMAAGNSWTGAYWPGSIAELTVSTPSSNVAKDVALNFNLTADRFRTHVQEEIVADGLVLNFDAANANNGLRFPGTGCSETTWFDLTSNFNDGFLKSFVNCSSNEGWNGDGSTASPFRLTFDGGANYVATNYVQTNVTEYTVEAWVNTALSTGTRTILNDRQTNGLPDIRSLTLELVNGVPSFVCEEYNKPKVGTTATTSIADGSWHHVVGTWKASTGRFSIYIDGGLNTSDVTSITVPVTGIGGTEIGRNQVMSGGQEFKGSLAKLAIYTRELLASEVLQNYNALAPRF